MRDPLGLNERLFALWYPYVCGLSENAGQREIRRELIADASGRTLEIGAGSGLNLPHYTDAVTELVVTEPSPHMREHLTSILESDPLPVGSWELVDSGAESLPFEDASFDTVVGTYVFCSIPDPEQALAELARVLKPGGLYIYLEHVHAGEGTMLGRFQDAIEVPHRYIAAGCHPNRRMAEMLDSSPLEVESLERGSMPRAMPSVRPTIRGAARRPVAAGAAE
ncbi:MAG: class I SAM-dependent methyltransferase [Solirubrobacterales bacterium]